MSIDTGDYAGELQSGFGGIWGRSGHSERSEESRWPVGSCVTAAEILRYAQNDASATLQFSWGIMDDA
jgi:hypothetical protein